MTPPTHVAEMKEGLSNLVSSRTEFGERPPVPCPMHLTPRDRLVLRELGEHRYLSTRMIASFCWGSHASTRLQTRLKLMHDAHLVRRFRPASTTPRQQLEWVYELDVAGAVEVYGNDVAWAATDLHDFAYVEHDLELNGLLIELSVNAVGTAAVPAASLPFAWLGDRTGAIYPDREGRPLDAHPDSEAPAGAIFEPGMSHVGVLDPDATLVGRGRGDETDSAIFIEYDRTRRPSKLVGKFQRYDWFLTSGWRRSRYARLAGPPLALFVTKRESQLAGVVQQADEVLNAHLRFDDRPDRDFAGRQRIGFTSADRLDDRNDAVTLVSATPGSGDRRQARLDLGAVFQSV